MRGQMGRDASQGPAGLSPPRCHSVRSPEDRLCDLPPTTQLPPPFPWVFRQNTHPRGYARHHRCRSAHPSPLFASLESFLPPPPNSRSTPTSCLFGLSAERRPSCAAWSATAHKIVPMKQARCYLASACCLPFSPHASFTTRHRYACTDARLQCVRRSMTTPADDEALRLCCFSF